MPFSYFGKETHTRSIAEKKDNAGNYNLFGKI